ncbi:MAG: TetR/AcrR family transcriptional regulator [Spirochaetaceae bacterium]|jgi:AcrR family transcriptional regulator|nr:TetR/AcrR family transcriptional regulator [Spirochaetaceae bacterium]
MKKQQEICDATRKNFIDAFCALYKKSAPDKKITVQELSKKAGYNRCTFYQYFNDVDDILTSLEDMVISYTCEHMAALIKHSDFADMFIESFVAMQTESKMATYIKVLLGTSNSAKFALRLKAALLPVFMERFNVQKTDIKSIYVLEFYLSGIISIGNRWLQNGREIDTEELGSLIRGLLTKGVLHTLKKK